MAERRRSAHAGDDQNNGGTLSAKKPRDPQSSSFIDRWGPHVGLGQAARAAELTLDT